MLELKLKDILKGLIIGLGILLVVIALSFIGANVASKTNVPDASPVPVVSESQSDKESSGISYVINKGGGQKPLKLDYTLREGERQTVFDILKDLSREKNIGLEYSNDARYGIFVESIAGIKNGTDKKYWQYYINDVLGDVAADKKEVKAKDVVEWRFEDVSVF